MYSTTDVNDLDSFFSMLLTGEKNPNTLFTRTVSLEGLLYGDYYEKHPYILHPFILKTMGIKNLIFWLFLQLKLEERGYLERWQRTNALLTKHLKALKIDIAQHLFACLHYL